MAAKRTKTLIRTEIDSDSTERNHSDQRTTFSDRTLNSTTQSICRHNNFSKSMKTVDLETIQTVAEGKQNRVHESKPF